MQCPYCSSPISTTAQVCPSCGGRLNQSQHLPAGTVLDRKYRIEQALGQGGFGITYKATHVTLGQTVAVKEYFPEGATRQGTNVITTLGGGNEFLEEGQRLAQLQHPGIVRVQDILSENNTVYLVMEFVSGKSLKQVLDDRGQLSETEAIAYIQKVAEALEVVHQAGLLHQDLKPDNLMLTSDGRVVLIDFGASRHFLSDKTGNYTRVVTPGYGSLEQYGSNVKRGPYTDIYALGATLYTLLTGQTPLAAPDRVHDPDLPHLTCSTKVKKAIERSMEISFSKRQYSVMEFIEELRGDTRRSPRPVPSRPGQPPTSARDITQDIAKGGTLQLPRGRYRVNGPVVLGGNLELRGEGSDTTIELCIPEQGFGVYCPEGKEIKLGNLNLTVVGGGDSAITIEGNYAMERLVLEGSGEQGIGLCFAKSATGVLVGSYVLRMGFGMVFRDTSSGEIRHNICEANTYHGIQIGDDATPELIGNTSRRNGGSGISYFGKAAGAARGNSTERNSQHGFDLAGQAAPTLEGNTCLNNNDHGIHCEGRTTGIARNNTCEANAHGIFVGAESTPTLESNVCKANARTGITVTDRARCQVTNNVCEGNQQGIYVGEQAQAAVNHNLCKDNSGYGIVFAGRSAGSASANQCSGNPDYDIAVLDQANVNLSHNSGRTKKRGWF